MVTVWARIWGLIWPSTALATFFFSIEKSYIVVAIKRHHFYPWLAPGEYQQCHFSSSLECAKQELSPAQTGAIRSSLGSLPPLPVTKSLAWNSKHYSQITSTSITGVPIGFSTVLIWVFLDFCIGRAPWSIWQSLLHLLLCYSPSQEICHSLQAAVAAAREAAITCISKALHKKSKKRYWETESKHPLLTQALPLLQVAIAEPWIPLGTQTLTLPNRNRVVWKGMVCRGGMVLCDEKYHSATAKGRVRNRHLSCHNTGDQVRATNETHVSHGHLPAVPCQDTAYTPLELLAGTVMEMTQRHIYRPVKITVLADCRATPNNTLKMEI